MRSRTPVGIEHLRARQSPLFRRGKLPVALLEQRDAFRKSSGVGVVDAKIHGHLGGKLILHRRRGLAFELGMKLLVDRNREVEALLPPIANPQVDSRFDSVAR